MREMMRKTNLNVCMDAVTSTWIYSTRGSAFGRTLCATTDCGYFSSSCPSSLRCANWWRMASRSVCINYGDGIHASTEGAVFAKLAAAVRPLLMV